MHGRSLNKIPDLPPPPPPTPQRETSWWEKLSPERKLDVVGVILAFFGVIILLGLLANCSAIVGGVILFLAQLFGWGVYVLPIGLLVFGLWLVFRKIERIPPLSTERAVGSVILSSPAAYHPALLRRHRLKQPEACSPHLVGRRVLWRAGSTPAMEHWLAGCIRCHACLAHYRHCRSAG